MPVSQRTAFSIRAAQTKDLPILIEFLAKLALHVSGGEAQTLKDEEREKLRSVLHASLSDPDKLLIVAEVPKIGLVGMGYVYVCRSQGIWEQMGDIEFRSGIIDDVWIEPAYRKLGIFRSILLELVDFAEKHGASELVLEYSVSNKEAKSVWTKLGFKTTGVRAAALTSTVKEAI